MLKRFLSRKISIPLAGILAIGAAVAFGPALADYTPPALVDAQTFLVSFNIRRLGSGQFGCSGGCRTAEAGGANANTCRLDEAAQAGPLGTAISSCLAALSTDCIPVNVHHCASAVRP